MMQQQLTSQPMTPAPDETGYYMPGAPGRNDTWVYGDPASGGGQAISGYQTGSVHQMEETSDSQAPIPGLNGGETLGGMSSAAAQSQRMENPVSMAHTHMPAGADEAYQASLRSLLDRNKGYFVEATFMVGPDRPVTWKGILHSVGSDYVVLYQPDYERYISGDLYSLKFVQFHNIKGVPYCSAAQSWQGHPNL